MTMQCEHYDCRCLRAVQLATIADRTGNVRYMREAIHVHQQKVECRRIVPSAQPAKKGEAK